MTKQTSIALNDEIKHKVDLYLEAKNTDSNKKLSMAGYIRNLIEDDLKDKVLENNIIELKEAYYIDGAELFEKKRTVATTNDDKINDLEKMLILEKTPNNLDTFSQEHETYCTNNNKFMHRGIYILSNVDDEDDNDSINYRFTYNSKEKTITIQQLNNIDFDIDKTDNKQLKLQKELLTNWKKFDSLMELDMSNEETCKQQIELIKKHMIIYKYTTMKNHFDTNGIKFEIGNNINKIIDNLTDQVNNKFTIYQK